MYHATDHTKVDPFIHSEHEGGVLKICSEWEIVRIYLNKLRRPPIELGTGKMALSKSCSINTF